MKKLMRKLVLSCFALGLAVVTLTTTTFAWYTTNKEVSATGIKGKTQGEVSGSLEISADTTSWGPTVEISAYKDGFDGSAMVPLQLIVPGKGNPSSLCGLNLTNNAEAGVAAGAGSYIKFVVYVRNSTTVTDKDTPIYLKELVIENTTEGGLPVKNQLVDKGIAGFDNTNLGNSYSVDAVRALSMTFTSHTYANNFTGNNETRYSVAECQDNLLAGTSLNVNSADALAYYNAVMNHTSDESKNVKMPDDYTEINLVKNGSNKLQVGTIPAGATTDQWTTITFSIWLEGWDKLCFDACQGQTFDISLKLTSDSTECKIGH